MAKWGEGNFFKYFRHLLKFGLLINCNTLKSCNIFFQKIFTILKIDSIKYLEAWSIVS